MYDGETSRSPYEHDDDKNDNAQGDSQQDKSKRATVS